MTLFLVITAGSAGVAAGYGLAAAACGYYGARSLIA